MGMERIESRTHRAISQRGDTMYIGLGTLLLIIIIVILLT